MVCVSALPSVNDRDFTLVPELTVLAGNSHVAKGGTTEVEVRSVRGAARALIRYNNRHRSLRAYACVHTLHLIARPTPFPLPKQHWPHRPHSCLQRLHVHQRSVPTCPSFS